MFWDFWVEELDEKLLAELGFGGACIFDNSKGEKLVLLKAEKIFAKKEREIKTGNSDFSILVRPDEKIQRLAVRRCLVDGINAFARYPVIKEMAEKNIALVVSFNDLLNSSEPHKIMGLMRNSIKLAKKYKTPIIIVSGAKNRWELRSASELIAFGEILGLSPKEAKNALFSHQEKIRERQTLKKQGKYIMPGARII